MASAGRDSKPRGLMGSNRRMGLTEAFMRTDEEYVHSIQRGISERDFTVNEAATNIKQERQAGARPRGWLSSNRGMGLAEAFMRTDENYTQSAQPGLSERDCTINETATNTQAEREAGARSRGWLSSNRGIGLTEAYQRTDENGHYIPAARSASAQPILASPEKSKMWDADLDFTAQSIQMSTSPRLRVKSPNSKIDEIRLQEIEDLTARAVASNRLEEIRERNSEVGYEAGRETVLKNTHEHPAGDAAVLQPKTSTLLYPPKPYASAARRAREIAEQRGREMDEQRELAKDRSRDLAQQNAITPMEYHEKTILEEEGEKIPFSPITVFKQKDFDDYVKRNNLTFSNPDASWRTRRRPRSSHTRDESHEVLKQLSRSLSRSPATPDLEDPKSSERLGNTESKKEERKENTRHSVHASGSEPEKEDVVEAPEFSDVVNEVELKKEEKRKDPVHPLSASDSEPEKKKNIDSNHPVSVVDMQGEKQDKKEDQISVSVRDSELEKQEKKEDPSHPVIIGDSEPEKEENNLNAIRSLAVSDSDPEERIAAEARLFELQDKSERGSIRAPSPDILSLPTPRVTGAYIETPIIRKARSTSPRTRELRPASRFQQLRAPVINTAKHVSAIEDVRRIQLEAKVEDSTLEVFGESLQFEAAAEGHTKIEPILDLEYNEHGLPLSQKEIDRRIEDMTLERMNKSLKATSTSIRAARKGIERLEEQVSSSFIQVAPTQPSDGTISININIKIALPKLWVSQPSRESGMKSGWKLTWLGFVLLIFFCWYITESAMCYRFCHPKNSRVNSWQPSDPFFPWAIPTKLDQWTGELVSSSLGALADSLGLKGGWDLGLPKLPAGYKGGPIGPSDWWLGRDGPVVIPSYIDNVHNMSDDEMILA